MSKNPVWVHLPAVALCVIACNQIRLAKSSTLSPWKGGGFGMFATQDSPGARFIHVEGVRGDGVDVTISFSSIDLRELGESRLTPLQIRTYPRQQDLVRLGEILLAGEFVESGVGEVAVWKALMEASPDLQEVLPPIIRSHGARVPMRVRREGAAGHDSATVHTLENVVVSVWKVRMASNATGCTFELLTGPYEIGK